MMENMGPDELNKLSEALNSILEMVEQVRGMMPTDNAEEQSENIDEATQDEQMSADDVESIKPSSDPKDIKKMAAMAMIKKQLG